MYRITRCAVLSLVGFLLSSQVFAAAEISYSEGRLTIQAHQVPFNDLMQQLASETGIQVTIFGDPAGPVTIDIQEETLDTAMGKLAPNHMLVKSSRSADAPVTEIVIMLDDRSSGGAVSSEFLPSGAPVTDVIVDQPIESEPVQEDLIPVSDDTIQSDQQEIPLDEQPQDQQQEEIQQ